MPLTKESPEVTQYIIDLLKTNAASLGFKAENIRRGEHTLIPEYPAINVRTGPKRRSYATTRQYEIEFRTFLTIMYGKVGEIELSEDEVEELAETVETKLQTDPKLGGLVYNSWVEAVDPGIRLLGTSQIRATRITHRAQSREQF